MRHVLGGVSVKGYNRLAIQGLPVLRGDDQVLMSVRPQETYLVCGVFIIHLDLFIILGVTRQAMVCISNLSMPCARAIAQVQVAIDHSGAFAQRRAIQLEQFGDFSSREPFKEQFLKVRDGPKCVGRVGVGNQ